MLHQLVDWIATIESCILIDGVVKPRKVSTEGKRTLVSWFMDWFGIPLRAVSQVVVARIP
jgi:hypothetical protein